MTVNSKDVKDQITLLLFARASTLLNNNLGNLTVWAVRDMRIGLEFVPLTQFFATRALIQQQTV